MHDDWCYFFQVSSLDIEQKSFQNDFYEVNNNIDEGSENFYSAGPVIASVLVLGAHAKDLRDFIGGTQINKVYIQKTCNFVCIESIK